MSNIFQLHRYEPPKSVAVLSSHIENCEQCFRATRANSACHEGRALHEFLVIAAHNNVRNNAQPTLIHQIEIAE